MEKFNPPQSFQILGIYKGTDKTLIDIIKQGTIKLIDIALSGLWFLACTVISMELSKKLSLMFHIEDKFGSVVDFLILLLIFFLIFIIPMIFIIKKAFSILESKLGKKLKSIFGLGDIYNESLYLTLNYFNENQIVVRKYIPSPSLGYYLHEQFDSKLLEYFIPYLKGGQVNGIECFTLKGDAIRVKVKSNTDFIEGININKIRFRIQGYNSPKERQELVDYLNDQIQSSK